MKIAWITDSTASIPKQFAENNDIFVIPLNIVLGEKSFKEGEEITIHTFFHEVEKSGKNPSSSQPSTGDFLQVFETIQDSYDVAIGIFTSSRLSGTFQNARLAAGMLESSFPIHLIDSLGSSYVLARLVEEGQKLASQGVSLETILANLEQMKEKSRVYIMISELDFLHRGGRVSGTGLLIGGFLKIKPILHLHEGEMKLLEKVRGEGKAQKRIIEIAQSEIPSTVSKVAIAHADCYEKALDWKTELEQHFPHLSFEIIGLSPVVATHSGKNAIGLMWL